MTCYAVLIVGANSDIVAADLFALIEKTADLLSPTDPHNAKLLQEVLENREAYEDETLSLDTLQPLIPHIIEFLIASEIVDADTPLDISLQSAETSGEATMEAIRHLYREQDKEDFKGVEQPVKKERKEDELPRSNLYIEVPPTLH